jgi:hypothetical protein
MSTEYPHAAEYSVSMVELELKELTEPNLPEDQDNKFVFEM